MPPMTQSARIVFLAAISAQWVLAMTTLILLRTGFLPDVSWFLPTVVSSIVLMTLALMLYATFSLLTLSPLLMKNLRRLCALLVLVHLVLCLASVAYETTHQRIAGTVAKQTALPLTYGGSSACLTAAALVSLLLSFSNKTH